MNRNSIKPILLLSSIFLCGCIFSAKNKANNTTIPSMEDTVVITKTINTVPSVEDTVKYQIGGKLYYYDDLQLKPEDSITVIETEPDAPNNYRQYRFIVHNRYSYSHRLFESKRLDSKYKSYLDDKSFVNFYNSDLGPQMDSVRVEYIAPEAVKYNGFWVYLTEYEGDYYLDNIWEWLSSFKIADSIYTQHYMDGPYPDKIRRFEVDSRGGFKFTYGKFGTPMEFILIDKKRQIYRLGDRFVTPAKAIHNFEIIEYANNTGDIF